MRVLIIEDESLAAATLQGMLGHLDPKIKVLGILETVEAAVNWLKQHQADLIFMDIHLGDGESFQIFQQVKINIPVIFTTAFDQYALKAFKNQGIDYLLKPFDEDDVQAALFKLGTLRAHLHPTAVTTPLMDPELELQQKVQSRFMVKVGKQVRTVPAAEVAYFMADDKYLFLITTDHQHYIVEETISSMERKLDPLNFFRINRKFIIHINAIQEMYKLSRNRLRITLMPQPAGLEVVVSEERSGAFQTWLNQ